MFEEDVKPRLPALKSVEIPNLYLGKIAHLNIILSETAQEHGILEKQHSTLAPQTRNVYSLSSRIQLQHYMKSSCHKTRAINTFKKLFGDIDILITPTTACLPKKLDPRSLNAGEFDESNLLKTMWFVYMANLCGLPSITINAGYSKSGLPIGVMLTGAWWREDQLYTAALNLETQLRKPTRFYGPN